jgi:S-methylmethionine transporter
VTVFENIGLPYAADFLNFVILTAILSAANSGLYASGRMLWSLSNQGTLPKSFSKLTKKGIPAFAILVSMLGGLLALLTSIIAPDTVFVALTAISGFAVVAVWLSICASHYFFRKQLSATELSALKYKATLYPLVPILGFILCLIACIGLAFDPEQRIALYCGIPFVVLCFIAHHFTQSNPKRAEKNDQ